MYKSRRLLMCLLMIVSAALTAPPGSAQTSPPTHLRVVLFKYIPDAANDQFQALTQRIKDEFKRVQPNVELELRPMNIQDDKLDLYNTSPTAQESVAYLLSRPVDQGGYDMAEIDTVILGDLIEADLLRPWSTPVDNADWHPAATRAVTVGQDVYGIPHWLCGHFIFSRNQKVAGARTNSALIAALDSTRNGDPMLVGRLTGSWNVPSVYLDAYADTYEARNLDPGISIHLDPLVTLLLKTFAAACKSGNQNPCTNGKFDDPDVPTALFSAGKAGAMFGYSERLHLIRRKAPTETFYLSSAPIGEGDHPLLFTDAFVMRKDCDSACEHAARAFAEYMNSPNTQAWILMSKDATVSTIPRYLIPATRSAFQSEGVREDPYYQKIESEINPADPFPSFWFSKIHKEMRDKIMLRLMSQ